MPENAIELLPAITLGLAAGGAHVFAGPDHLAAIAPLAVGARRRQWLSGLAWGLGHSVGVGVLAIITWVARQSLPLEVIGAVGEWAVGVLLLVLGLWGWRRLIARRVHVHVHEHDGVEHAHIHVHSGPIESGHTHDPHEAHTHSALGIGTLHGLAGAAHLLAILPAVGLDSNAAAAAYLVCFCIGSVAAMSVFSWILGTMAGRLEQRGVGADRWLAGGSCTAAIGIGVWWLIANA